MDLGLAGRVAVVTGASKGIGRAVADELVASGVKVVISARGKEGLDRAVEELQLISPLQGLASVVGVLGDATEPRATEAIVQAAVRLGGADILVNNAGGQSGHLPIERLTDEDWESAYRLNVVSSIRLTVALLPHMRGQRWGRIVNVSSNTARVPEPFCAPYAAAKAALVNLTRSLSRSYGAEGVCVNCVLPGLTFTEGAEAAFVEAMAATGRSQDELVQSMLRRAPIDAGRMGTASEVADAIVFLCSERASWIMGVALPIDGGTIRSAP
ncbi:MAG: SDR family NAD(P)-dependent oxidoreductase [Fimbriimonadales bacterium]